MECSVPGCKQEPYTIYVSNEYPKGIPMWIPMCKQHNLMFIEALPVLKALDQVKEIVENA